MSAIKAATIRLFVFTLLATLVLSTWRTPADAATFQAGRIIDDAVFTNTGAISTSGIQSFFNAKDSTCLKDYLTPSIEGNNEYGSNVPAAKAIKQASNLYGINAQVLIATLEKENGLVTRDDCPSWRYRTAMGFACPDGEACDSQYFGFSKQLYQAARHFRGFYTEPDGWFIPFSPGTNFIQYNPDPDCGGSNVDIFNHATAALYSYTPYQPNAATKAADPGEEVPCGAYGNINFWRYFNSWFGPSVLSSVDFFRYKSNTDKTGDWAIVGLKLGHKPSSNVVVPVAVSSSSNARIVGGVTKIHITPDEWNRPDLNKVTIAGVDNPNLTGTTQYWLRLGQPDSKDKRFANLPSSAVEDVALAGQDPGSAPNVYRLYHDGINRHYFTAIRSERDARIAGGWRDEGVGFYYCAGGDKTIIRLKDGDNERRMDQENSSRLSIDLRAGFKQESVNFAASSQGSVPIYWHYSSSTGNSLYKDSPSSSAGYENLGVAFRACEASHKAVYRLYNPKYKTHFFTASTSERNSALGGGYRYEGVAFYNCTDGTESVYRLFNRLNKNRFYTTSAAKRDKAVAGGYIYEGIAFRVCTDSTRDVYRLYRRSTGGHLYTSSAAERDRAVSNHGYVYEGVGFEML